MNTINQLVNLAILLCISSIIAGDISAPLPRKVRVSGQKWTDLNGDEILLKGPNIVVKGSPWLPRVEGNTRCNDTNTTSCYTFNEADARHITETMGYNFIRLGVTWAGAQPTDENKLDDTFVTNLQDILQLCDQFDIHVLMDFHSDMVSSANCGFGVPMWFSKKAIPGLIGQPLRPGLPFNSLLSKFTDSLEIRTSCDDNEEKWNEFAGDDNYNLLNQCCRELNYDANNFALATTHHAQETLNYLFKDGRNDFIRFWRLIAEEVKEYPSAIAIELMNEPVSIHRGRMYETWEAAYDAIVEVIPDMSVGVMDTAEAPVFPYWIDPEFFLWPHTVKWLKTATNLFYAWHWYDVPSNPLHAVGNVRTIMKAWNISSILTETMSCEAINAAEEAGLSWSYWHYSRYCDTAPQFGSKLPPESFGACILGWDDADSSKSCGDVFNLESKLDSTITDDEEFETAFLGTLDHTRFSRK